jgi:hemerythrin superfamily protein
MCNIRIFIFRSRLEELKNYFTDFHEMLLAHAAFEESVLFPVLEGTLSGDELKELKMRGTEQEESLFGPDATQKVFDMLYQLEAAAGVKGASHYTKKPDKQIFNS